MADFPDHSAALAALVGQSSGPIELSPDPVNTAMIRHWVEAMGDTNPVYTDHDAAVAAGYPGIVAPATMLQAWIMRGLKHTLDLEAARAAGNAPKGDANSQMMALFDEEGRTSVVATNCDQEYFRPLVLGDRLLVKSSIESISDPKQTGLGHGRFATSLMEFFAVPNDAVTKDLTNEQLAERGELVGTMRFRILKFRPGTGAVAPKAKPPRPRPAITQDNAFYFEGTLAGELRIQRCTDCGALRHPPLPACGKCAGLNWDYVVSEGRGELFSMVVNHFPQVPAFDYPLPIGLIALDEGTRIVANLAGEPGDWTIGDRVVAEIVRFDDELALPVFHHETKEA